MNATRPNPRICENIHFENQRTIKPQKLLNPNHKHSFQNGHFLGQYAEEPSPKLV